MGGKCCKNDNSDGTNYDDMKVKKTDKIQRKDDAAAAATTAADKTTTATKKSTKKEKKNVLTFKNEVIEFHQLPVPGKFTFQPIKPITSIRSLAMVHTPGVAEPCMEIKRDPSLVYKLTNKSRTVALVTNGSSVLGLGNLGPDAAKPDIEGKAMLYKRFAGVDCVDLCIDESDCQNFINIVKVLGPSFGAINLEDMKAPDCFIIEYTLQEEMPIPVFHNDQHGTAVVVVAALMNALEI